MRTVFTINFKWNLHKICWTLYKICLLVTVLTSTTYSNHAWQLPGCHRLGEYNIVCRGVCPIKFNVTQFQLQQILNSAAMPCGFENRSPLSYTEKKAFSSQTVLQHTIAKTLLHFNMSLIDELL